MCISETTSSLKLITNSEKESGVSKARSWTDLWIDSHLWKENK